MEVLEAIQKRRTVRVPFAAEVIADDVVKTLLEVARISPSGDPISWRVERVEDSAKSKLSAIVKEDFGAYFQKNTERFKQVFSQYPRWLRFSEAKDGIQLAGFPKAAQPFYRFALGPGFGPMFGKLGIMNAEINSYCRNIVANPALFGVFLDRRVNAPAISPIINTGSMLQNLRLAATSFGLSYQDLGWITATKTAADKARVLLGISADHRAVNFFRIGHADGPARSNKKSDFRRDLNDIVHIGRFGQGNVQGYPAGKTEMHILDAIRGRSTARGPGDVTFRDIAYILEAARWAPTGFNVQPFEYLVTNRNNGGNIVVLEDRDRRDPDPGPCEALARGGVLQNIRLASRALGLTHEIRKVDAARDSALRSAHQIPPGYSQVAEIRVRGN